MQLTARAAAESLGFSLEKCSSVDGVSVLLAGLSKHSELCIA
jgi:hypothetical protein